MVFAFKIQTNGKLMDFLAAIQPRLRKLMKNANGISPKNGTKSFANQQMKFLKKMQRLIIMKWRDVMRSLLVNILLNMMKRSKCLILIHMKVYFISRKLKIKSK